MPALTTHNPHAHAHARPAHTHTHTRTRTGLVGNLVSHTASQSATITAARGSLSKDLVKGLKVQCTLGGGSPASPPGAGPSQSAYNGSGTPALRQEAAGVLAMLTPAGAATGGGGGLQAGDDAGAQGGYSAIPLPSLSPAHAPAPGSR